MAETERVQPALRSPGLPGGPSRRRRARVPSPPPDSRCL